MTRVSAKYIRKLAAKYDIQINHELRKNEVKEIYVAMIGEAICDEQARLAYKEEVQQFVDEVEEAVGNRYLMVNLNSFNKSCAVFYKATNTIIGYIHNNTFRYNVDGRNVRRIASSTTEAVDRVIARHMNQMVAA